MVLNEDGGYLLDQEEAITYLLREHGNSDENLKLAPIGSDCYEVHPSDGVYLEVNSKNGLPVVKAFPSLVISMLGLRDAHKATRQTQQPLLHDW